MNIPFKQYWDLLAKHIRPQRGRFTLLTALLLGSIGLQIANPQIVRAFIDAATSGAGGEALGYAALAFVGIALLQQVVAVSATYVGENVAWTATNALRAELANFFSQLVVRVLGNLLLLLGILVALLLEDWRVSLAFTLFAAISLLTLNQVRGIAVPHYKARRQAFADLFGYIEEQLAGSKDIRSSGAVGFVMRGLYQLHYEILSTTARRR